MEAPVLLDRVYNESALTSSNNYRQSSPNRIVDTTFTGGRQPSANYGYGTNPSYSSTSSTSSFRQEATGLRDTNNFRRNSPLRDPYSSTTSSTSTLIGGGGISNINQVPATYSTSDRIDGAKNVTYKFNLSEFAPEDIAIQVNDTMLKVTALKEERDQRGSTHREFRREIGKMICL
jgi:HSP20 family molecular chaperone IbpA